MSHAVVAGGGSKIQGGSEDLRWDLGGFGAFVRFWGAGYWSGCFGGGGGGEGAASGRGIR